MRDIKFRFFNEGLMCSDIGLDMDFANDMPAMADSLGYTVMQYTGLKDKNGVEIYEGDIIDKKYKWVVEFNNGQWLGVTSINPLSNNAALSEIITKRNIALVPIQIIGNIHEDPELLEES